MQLRVRRSAVVLTALAVVLGGTAAIAATQAQAAPADTTAPTLTSYRALPTTVDDTQQAAQATVVVRVADTAPAGVTPAGFAQGTLTLANGTGSTLGPIGFDDTDRTSGTNLDGTYDIPVTVPQGTPAGSYTGSVYLQDLAGANATASVATTLTVTRANDTTAPALVSLTATPNAVDITRAGGTVHFAARITDAQAGTRDARLTLTAPDGSTDQVVLNRDTGTAADGSWTADYPVQSWTQTGTWAVATATLSDYFGNTASTPTSTSFTVTQTPDTTKPTFVGISLDRTSVDASDGDQHVQARITASDDLSGVASGYVAFVDPVSNQQVDGVFTADPNAQTTQAGTWSADITVPAFTTAGTYALADVQIVDNQGNTLELCTPPTTDGYDAYGNCDGTPPSSTITVTTSDDSTPPTLANFALGPGAVTVAYQGSARVDGAFDVADATSGFASAEVTLVNGTSTQTVDLTPDDLARGTVHSGTVVFSTYFGPSDAGTWTATDVTVTDLAGNTTDTAGAALGGNRTVVVGTAATDTAAPTLTALTINPSVVNTTAGAQDVTVTAGVTDAQAGAVSSGVATVSVTLESPTGQDVTADLTDLASGNNVTGAVSGPVTIGRYATAGIWKVVAASVVDGAGHERDYGRGDPALATAVLTVVPAIDLQAPTINSVTVPAAVDASTAGRNGTTVPVHVAATDSGSGIDDVGVTVTAPDGTSYSVGTPVPNTAHIDTTLDVPVPGYGSAGRWTVTGVEIDSDNGPDAVLGPAALLLAGVSASFVVTAPGDTTAPAVASVAITPSPISTSGATVDADLLVRLTDAGSGVSTAWVTLTSPHGYQSLSAALSLTAGDAGDGWWQGAVRLPRFVDPGTWSIEVSSVDVSGNGGDTSGAALAARGLVGSVAVTGSADTSAPVLDSLTLGRAVVDLSSLLSPTALPVELTAHDTGSGVAAVDVGVTAPDGTTRTVSGTPAATSTPATASYAASIPLPLTSPAGTWSVGPVVVHDLAGNVTTLTHAQLVAAHLTASFTVIGAVQIVTPPPLPTATVPGAVLAPTATLADATSATVTWAAPAVTGGSAVTGYLLTPYRNGVAGGALATANTSATVTNLVKGASYTFAVQAVNAVGTGAASPISAAVAVPTTVPAPPAVGSVSVAGTTVTLGIAAPSDTGGMPLTGYTVTPWVGAAASPAVAVDSNASSATVTGLSRGTTYRFTLTAANAKGSSPSSVASAPVTVAATTPAAPGAVTAVQPPGASALVVSWTKPADSGGAPVTGYALTPYRDGVAQPVIALGNVVSTTVSPVVRGSSYTFSVTAVNAAGSGSPSDPSPAVTVSAAAPAAPTAVTAARSGSSVTLTWAAPSDTGGAPVTGYVVTPDTGGVDQDPVTVGASTTTTLTDLPLGATYTFTVAAQNSAGVGTASATSAPVTLVAPTALSLGSVSSTLAYGSVLRVSGTLARTDTGDPLGGEVVALQYRRHGSTGAFSTFPTTARTSAAGAVTFATFTPGYSVDVRLTHTAAGAFAGTTTAARTTMVAAAVSIAASATSLRYGRTVRISGTVSPSRAGSIAYLQRKSGSSWVNVTHATLGSGYAFIVKPARGTTTYRVTVPSNAAWAVSTSGTEAVRAS